MEWHKWIAELKFLGERLSDLDLSKPSPWVGRTIKDSLVEDNEDCWVDRYAAGYTPQEALDEILKWKKEK